ncbi:MAG TPA: zinc ribbon domain-containing protein [Planktothrix sp.]|jgi:hypothetical protein
MAVQLISNPQLATTNACPHCATPVDDAGRFCGECGAPTSRVRRQAQAQSLSENGFVASFQRTATVAHPHEEHEHKTHPTPVQAEKPAPPQRTPTFATVNAKVVQREVPNELREEINKLVCLLAREKVFLIMHWCIFLSLNLSGLFIAFTAYNGYIGDEVTKTVISLTPMMFINTLALLCLSPIKGTKKEIARLTERLSYVRFQAEYSNLF